MDDDAAGTVIFVGFMHEYQILREDRLQVVLDDISMTERSSPNYSILPHLLRLFHIPIPSNAKSFKRFWALEQPLLIIRV
jgi:hypothetical protein